MAYINGNEILFSSRLTGIGYAVEDLKELIDGSITEFEIPNGTSIVRQGAFQNTSLTRVTIPGSVTEIKNSAFNGCKNLTEVTFSEGLLSIGLSSFGGCSLNSVEIPSTVTSVAKLAFNGNSLTKVVFKGKPNSIGNTAFGGATGVIECPWKEGEVADAPWGATNATILYKG